MADFLSQLKSGLSAGTNSVGSLFSTGLNGINDLFGTGEDTREPDRTRPRVQSSDPTVAIDKSTKTSVLSFPLDRPKYFISFAVEEYRRPSMFEGLSSTGLTDYISLPMPNNLDDTSTLVYQEEEGDFLIDAGSSAFNTAADKFKTGGLNAQAFGSALQGLGSLATGEAARRIKDMVTGNGNLVTRAGKGLFQSMGLADNPFMTIQFRGPQFKQHQFSWRLSPNSPAEQQALQKITNSFKKIAHPEILSAANGGFYKFPNIVRPRFNPDTARDHLYKFKPCVITGVAINWSPNDRPAFFSDETPIEAVLTLQLQEIELWRNGDELSGPLVDKNGDFNSVSTPTARDLGSI